LASALEWGSRGREFKSHRPDHFGYIYTMDKSFKERRKHIRIYRKFILNYHEKGKSVIKYHISQVNNISKGGLSFASSHALTPGAVIIVDMKTPFIADPVRLEGVVLECREKVPDMIYEIRLQFQDVTRQAMAVLDKIEGYGKRKEE
jgi:hypothetical protein